MLKCFKRCFKTEKQTYILKLLNDKYYVGESSDIARRIWIHKNENGASWTKKYPVVKQNDLLPTNHNFSELIQTLLMIEKYGIDNVRGSIFSSPSPLSKYEKIMAAQLYCDLHNLCRKCGGNNHFISQCKNTTIESWVEQFGGKLTFEDTSRNCLTCNTSISSLPSNYRYCRQCFYNQNFKMA
jgi:hypothetical protein